MAIDVVIKQKLFGRKTIPLEVILGEHLQYGNFENDMLIDGKLGDTDFIAYHPHHIGRGFSVIWNPKETKSVSLRLPIPSTTAELRDFYDTVERITKYWNGRLTIDGVRLSIGAFMGSFSDFLDFNKRSIQHICQEVLDGDSDSFMLYSTMWPLDIGKEEAAQFLDNPNRYAQWLHEKQSVDACFVTPDFFMGDNGIFGRITLFDGNNAILPCNPVVPYYLTDPKTGKHAECTEWLIFLATAADKKVLCEMSYEKFLNILPKDKTERYDDNHFLLSRLSEDEIRTLANQ